MRITKIAPVAAAPGDHRAGRCVQGAFVRVAACGFAMLGPMLMMKTARASPAVSAPGIGALRVHSGLLAVVHIGSDFMVMDVSGPAGEPLLVKIVLPPNPSATYSFLMFQGLPKKFTMSSGFRTKNQWAVSLNDIGGLRIVPPPGYTGSFPLDVLLVKGKDAEPERRTMTVAFLPADTPTGATSNLASRVLTSGREGDDLDPIQPGPAAGASVVAQPMNDDDRFNMERGDALFQQGDVSAARLLYHRMAKKGVAAAAFAMGRTYDPDYLRALKVEGLQPDVAQAHVWYKMANELGSREARNRLLTLRQGN